MSALLGRAFLQARFRTYPVVRSATRAFATSRDAPDHVVTYSQMKQMLSTRNIQLLDVRNPDEFQAGKIPHAVNVPLDSLEESLQLSPEQFLQRFGVKAPLRDEDNLVFQCRSGKRSLKALDIARRLGFSKARHYEGGYSEWVELDSE
ncbi:thiosulfate:glutathione sulfurtransferase [Neosynchiropus ocellatus]